LFEDKAMANSSGKSEEIVACSYCYCSCGSRKSSSIPSHSSHPNTSHAIQHTKHNNNKRHNTIDFKSLG